MRVDDFALPTGLPVPEDDGACDHLVGSRLPSMPLPSSRGGDVDLAHHPRTVVLYVYPGTGVPGRPMPSGWDAMPGARGCTPQSCAYRDSHRDFESLGVEVMGLSAQSRDVQAEAAARLGLPYALLSDATLRFASAIGLPTFEIDRVRFLKRATILVELGTIRHVRYPVFPPNEDASIMVQWLAARAPP